MILVKRNILPGVPCRFCHGILFYTRQRRYRGHYSYAPARNLYQGCPYGPAASGFQSMRVPVKAKGIYLTGYTAGSNRFYDLLDLLNRTELNAMVIDVKMMTGL